MFLSVLPQTGASTNWTKAERKEFFNVNELAALITQNVYSGSLFRSNYCNNDNFESTELLVLDYDNKPTDPQLTLEQAYALFSKHKHIIATTRSHQKEKHGLPAADRFRVVLFLQSPITDEPTYQATWHEAAKQFPGCDQAAKDPARRLFPSVQVMSHFWDGQLFPITQAEETPKPTRIAPANGKRGKLSQKTKAFMMDGAAPGEWNNSLFKAAKDYYEQGYSQEEFGARAILITGNLDASDITTIESAYKKEPKYDARDPADLSRVEAWVRAWFEEKRVKQSYRTGVLTVGGKLRGADLIISDLVLDAISYAENNPFYDSKGNEKPRPPFSQQNIQHCFEKWLAEQDEFNLTHHTRSIQGEGTRSTINEWVQAVTGKQDEKDIAVITHFIWQVKRKLAGQKVDWHMMPILYGPTGSGKTEAIRALLKPVEELMIAPQDMAVLGDSREATMFSRFYVVFFDELARADKVDVSALKNKITSDYITYRRLGTNTQITKPNVSTFIGAANNPVQSLIYDPTSARRFWQLDTQERIDWNTINTLDYYALWRSVVASEAAPVLGVLDEVLRVQEDELRAKSLVEQWIETHTEEVEQIDLKATVAYEAFMEWCVWQQIRTPTTFTAFGMEIKRLGVKKAKKNNGWHYGLKLKQMARA